jgi:hypothetical protein
MRFRLFLPCVASLLIVQGRAQTDTTRPSASSTPSRTAAARPGAKGPLPDPVLLDGSNQPAEKKPDYGMLGEFEIPGDENSKSGKVGGQQNPNQKGGGGGQQQQNQNQSQQGGGGQMAGMPQGASGGGGAQSQSGPQGAQQAGGAAGGAQQAGQQSPQGAQGAAGAQGGDPNGKAEGIQVAGLEGDAAAGQAGGGGAPGDNVPKPQQVAIGDPTMQIKPVANAPGVVGQVTAGSTQQMESKIGKGSGGGGGSPTSGGGGKGVEKGRTMPAGL